MEIGSIAEIISGVFGVGVALISLIISLRAGKKAEVMDRNTVGSVLQVFLGYSS